MEDFENSSDSDNDDVDFSRDRVYKYVQCTKYCIIMTKLGDSLFSIQNKL